jgi:hypothetical protein
MKKNNGKILFSINYGLFGITIILAIVIGFMIGLPKLHPGTYVFFPSNPQTGQ